MKTNRLLTAMLAGLAGFTGNAHAVALNPEGIGQVLLYPYFTVNGGNQTLLSVVNTQNAGKVVKVRFREAYDGREVLDFNLYLSPYDVWTATVFDTSGLAGHASDGSAAAGLLTPDNSCTDPALKTGTPGQTEILPDGRNFVSFVNYTYGQSDTRDGGPIDLSRTRTGHIELIEMADVTGATLQAITHINGVPKNCAAVVGAQTGPDYVTPAGGLFGSASIVNVQNGTLFGANAEALLGFYTNTGNLFSAPGSLLPDLSSGDNNGNVATSHVFADDGSLISSNWLLTNDGGIDAVSSVLTAAALLNEYELNPTTGAVISEWIVTFPTKSYYVDPALPGAPYYPFTTAYGADPTNPGTACEKIVVDLYDREEKTPPKGLGFPEPRPGSIPIPTLCWESQAITFAPPSSLGPVTPLFATPLFITVDPLGVIGPSGTSGMLILTFASNSHLLDASMEGNVFAGLPAIGFLAKQFTNKNVTPGILGNYAGLFRHHATRGCTNNFYGACQ